MSFYGRYYGGLGFGYGGFGGMSYDHGCGCGGFRRLGCGCGSGFGGCGYGSSFGNFRYAVAHCTMVAMVSLASTKIVFS